MAIPQVDKEPVHVRGRQNLALTVVLLLVLGWRWFSHEIWTVAIYDLPLTLPGVALVAIGLWIRLCARQWKVEQGHGSLVMDGPYGLIRHPLYVGSFLLASGLCWILGDLVLWGSVSLLFWVNHGLVIRQEQEDLERLFGDEYRRYRQAVPSVLPHWHTLFFRPGRVVPRRLREAVIREADALCVWPSLVLLSEVGKWVALTQSDRPAPGVWYPLVLCAGVLVLAIVWVRWKRQYRVLLSQARRARMTARAA